MFAVFIKITNEVTTPTKQAQSEALANFPLSLYHSCTFDSKRISY